MLQVISGCFVVPVLIIEKDGNIRMTSDPKCLKSDAFSQFYISELEHVLGIIVVEIATAD